jgi:hypothetical protein
MYYLAAVPSHQNSTLPSPLTSTQLTSPTPTLPVCCYLFDGQVSIDRWYSTSIEVVVSIEVFLVTQYKNTAITKVTTIPSNYTQTTTGIGADETISGVPYNIIETGVDYGNGPYTYLQYEGAPLTAYSQAFPSPTAVLSYNVVSVLTYDFKSDATSTVSFAFPTVCPSFGDLGTMFQDSQLPPGDLLDLPSFVVYPTGYFEVSTDKEFTNLTYEIEAQDMPLGIIPWILQHPVPDGSFPIYTKTITDILYRTISSVGVISGGVLSTPIVYGTEIPTATSYSTSYSTGVYFTYDSKKTSCQTAIYTGQPTLHIPVVGLISTSSSTIISDIEYYPPVVPTPQPIQKTTSSRSSSVKADPVYAGPTTTTNTSPRLTMSAGIGGIIMSPFTQGSQIGTTNAQQQLPPYSQGQPPPQATPYVPSPYRYSSGGPIIIAGSTLAPSGPAMVVSGTTYSAALNSIIVNGVPEIIAVITPGQTLPSDATVTGKAPNAPTIITTTVSESQVVVTVGSGASAVVTIATAGADPPIRSSGLMLIAGMALSLLSAFLLGNLLLGWVAFVNAY